MTAPIALTIHDGHGTLPAWRQRLVAEWLTANRINPGQVSAEHPINVLTVPYQPPTDDGTPWLIQVIVFHQFYVGPDGAREQDFLTRKLVAFQRTVPLAVPFPATPTTADEGAGHGQTDGQAAKEAAEEVLRDSVQAGVSDPRQDAREGGTVAGGAARDEGAAEEGPRRSDEEVPKPEEDRRKPQEEVVGP